MDNFKLFYELAGSNYPEDEITYSSLSGIIRRKWVLRKIAGMPPGKLLDCGCNVGRLGAAWKKGDVFGIDISFSVLKKGKNIFPGMNFIHGDLRQMDFFRPDAVDNAIVIEVLEHLEQPDRFLKGLWTVVRRNGQVLITTPGYTFYRPRMVELGVIRSFGISRGTDGDRYFHTAYRPEELAQIAVNAGFSVIEKGSFEHELRGWVKPMTILGGLGGRLGRRWFPGSKMNYLLLKGLHNLEHVMFAILDTFGLSIFLKKIFKEGRRSYVLVKKQ